MQGQIFCNNKLDKNSRIQDQAQHTCTFNYQKRHEKVAKLRYLCFDNYPENRVKSNLMFSNTCTGNLKTKSKWPIIFLQRMTWVCLISELFC